MIRSKAIFIHVQRLDKETRNLFRDFFTKENPLLMLAESHWTPNTDVYETDKGIVVKMELAGVSQQDVEIAFRDRTLLVSGRRTDHATADKVSCRQIEIPYGEFHRAIPVDGPVDFDKASAQMKDGFLLIFLPYPASRKIRIE